MRGRLFLKIYLTVLGSIVVLALAGMVSLARLHDDRGVVNQRAAVLAAALPEGMDAATLQATLDRLGAASDAELAVLDADGAILASFRPAASGSSGRFDPVSVPLSEGRTLTAHFRPPFNTRQGSPLILVVLAAAGLTALAAWPVVRHLTGRLERLRDGVESWGKGDLSLRVPVDGGDEIAAVAASFNHAAEQVEALVAANRALLANASHELRSPLARLRMAMDLYEADPATDRRAEILQNLSELDDLVGEILLSSRLTHAGSEGSFERFDLLALAAEEAARAGLEASGAPTEIDGDARLLHRLVRNLIQNAKRHGRPPIRIIVEQADGYAKLVVRDHGPGIPGGEGERVFEPFFRPAGHGEAAGGWGLGLALVRQIAERHGGTAHVEAPPDGGARFVVSLPREKQE